MNTAMISSSPDKVVGIFRLMHCRQQISTRFKLAESKEGRPLLGSLNAVPLRVVHYITS